MELDLFESILSVLFTAKIDILRFALTSAVRLSFAHIDGVMQTHSKCSQVKDQKTGFIDESLSDMDTILIDDMYFL